MRIVIDSFGDRTKYFHTNVRFSTGFMSAPDSSGPEKTQELMKAILEIPGIQDVSVNRFKISVDRSLAVGWDEIEPKVRELIEAVGKDGNIV